MDFDVDEGFELSLERVDIPVREAPMAIAQDDRRPSPFFEEVLGDGVKPGAPGGMEKQVFRVDFDDPGRELEDPAPNTPQGIVNVRNVAVVMAHRPADVDVEVDVGAFDSPPPFPDRRNDPTGETEEVFPGDGWGYRNRVPFEGLFGRPVGQHPLDHPFYPFERPRLKQPDPVPELAEVGGFEIKVKTGSPGLRSGMGIRLTPESASDASDPMVSRVLPCTKGA